mgnify:CR=1 FL=1
MNLIVEGLQFSLKLSIVVSHLCHINCMPDILGELPVFFSLPSIPALTAVNTAFSYFPFLQKLLPNFHRVILTDWTFVTKLNSIFLLLIILIGFSFLKSFFVLHNKKLLYLHCYLFSDVLRLNEDTGKRVIFTYCKLLPRFLYWCTSFHLISQFLFSEL